MPKDLVSSGLDRQNILNNGYAVSEIENATGITGIFFEGKKVLTKEQVASFFEVDIRTIERYIESNGDELRKNGYEVLRGKRLDEFKKSLKEQFVTDIHVGGKTRSLISSILKKEDFN